MKSTKKVFAILLALATLFTLCACGGKSAPAAPAATEAPAAPAATEAPAAPAATEAPAAPAEEPYNVTIRFAHDSQPNQSQYALYEWLGQEIEARSNGQIKVEIFGGGQLSGNNSQVTAGLLTNGDVDMAVLASVTTKRWEIYKFPYLFSSQEEVFKCEEGESGQFMLKTLEEDANTHGLTYLANGFRVFSGKKPFNDVKELEGQKLRIINSTTFTEFAKALKATPVSTSMGELYTALEQGAADCQENPISTIYKMGFHNVTPYITMTNHVWASHVLGVNLDFWNDLPDAAKKILEECAVELAAKQRVTCEEDAAKDRENIVNEGGTIVDLTDEELAEWVKVGRSCHKNLVDLVGEDVIDLFYKDLGLTKDW